MSSEIPERPALRLWHQSYADLADLPRYREWIVAHGRRVLGVDSSLSVNGLDAGSVPPGRRGSYLARLKDLQVADAAIAAASAGFEAVAIGCIYDPGLDAARSAVGIPVLGLAETVLGHAAGLGANFGLVSPSTGDAEIVEALVDSYGLRSRLAASVVLEPPFSEPEMEALEGAAADACLASFLAACDRCREGGADLAIPSEGVLAEFLFSREPALRASLPVIDPFAVLWKQAEAAVETRRALGPAAGARPTIERAEIERVRRAVQEGWTAA